MQGAPPLASPGLDGARHWFDLPIRHPAGVPSESPTRRKSDRTTFLLEVPAAKERGDRGRGTSAFEMVLSPGAGRVSAAGKIALRARAGGLSFPFGEGGQGGKLKAGQGGDKAGTPPAGYSGGKPSRRPAGHAPPPGTAAARSAADQNKAAPLQGRLLSTEIPD